MNAFASEWSAILIVLLVGFLPNEVWRTLGVLVGRRLNENGLLMQWVKTVATALLAAVVARLLFIPTGAMIVLPLWLRLAAVAGGVAGFALSRRSVLTGVLVGEAALVGGAWWLGVP